MTTHKETIEIVEPVLFTAAVADEIVATIRDVLSEKERCSLVLSGGSTPGAIYRLLSMPPRIQEIDWNKIDLYLGDERYVPHDHSNSNFRMINETLLDNLGKVKPQMFAVDTNPEKAQTAALQYQDKITRSQGLQPGELPKFDIVLLGMGEDGHTASLFPGSKDLNSSKSQICIATKHTDGSQRISLTQHALFNAGKIIFIVKGASKASILKEVLTGSAAPETYPSRFFLEARERVSFFIDSEAAKLLHE